MQLKTERQQANFKKIVMPPTLLPIVYDSINRPGWCTSILPILGFLGISVLELVLGTRQTDRHHPAFYNVPPYGGRMPTDRTKRDIGKQLK